MDNRKSLPIWLCRLLSYISAFIYGGYVYAAVHGNPPEAHRWILTGFFGIVFFLMSLENEK